MLIVKARVRDEGGGKGGGKRLCRIVTADEMSFGSMHERGTIDAVHSLRRMQEEHHAKGNIYVFCGPRENI